MTELSQNTVPSPLTSMTCYKLEPNCLCSATPGFLCHPQAFWWSCSLPAPTLPQHRHPQEAHPKTTLCSFPDMPTCRLISYRQAETLEKGKSHYVYLQLSNAIGDTFIKLFSLQLTYSAAQQKTSQGFCWTPAKANVNSCTCTVPSQEQPNTAR